MDPYVLVVSGAGASCLLGEDEDMPQMSGWARSLAVALDTKEHRLAELLGLNEDLRGDEFERRLGEFFTVQKTFDRLDKFKTLGGPQPMVTKGNLEEWLDTARGRSRLILTTIRENLFESFGYNQFSDAKCTAAYTALMSILGDSGLRMHVATTNYDQTVEIALGNMGLAYEDGFIGSGPVTPRLAPDGLVDRANAADRIALLHLHGAVGWYELGGEIRKHPSDSPLNSSLGTPAILPPDDTKAVNAFAPWTRDLWQEFAQLVQEASHVLVIGHSLNDSHLVDELRKAPGPVAVCAYFSAPNWDVDAAELGRIYELLPSASAIPMSFGPDLETDEKKLRDFLVS
jgi:hypothetical protein